METFKTHNPKNGHIKILSFPLPSFTLQLNSKNIKKKQTHSNISSSTLFFSHIFFSFSLFLSTISPLLYFYVYLLKFLSSTIITLSQSHYSSITSSLSLCGIIPLSLSHSLSPTFTRLLCNMLLQMDIRNVLKYWFKMELMGMWKLWGIWISFWNW